MAWKDARFLKSSFPSCGPSFKSKKSEKVEYGVWDCTDNKGLKWPYQNLGILFHFL